MAHDPSSFLSRRQLLATIAAAEAAVIVAARPGAAHAGQARMTPSLPEGARVHPITSSGAVGDGRHDDGPAIQKAINAVARAGGGVVFIPPGTFKVSGGIEPKSGATIAGAGMDVSILKYDESAGQACFKRRWTEPEIDYVSFRDFTVIGPWKERPGSDDLRAFQIGAVNRLSFDHVGCRYIRGMSLTCQNCRNVEVSGCRIEYSAVDGISTHQCSNVRIEDCTILHCYDDAIAAHIGRHAKTPTPSGITITGCIIEDSMGVKILGAKAVSVTGNVLRRCKAYGLWIGVHDSGFEEGFTSSHSVSISGNVILDVMNLLPFGGGNICQYIRVGAYPASRATKARAVPGRPDPKGRFAKPWDQMALYNQGPAARTTHAGGYFWNIGGNVCARTLPAVQRYAQWGFGRAFRTNGWINPRISERTMRGDGIVIVESMRNAKIANNILFTGGRGVLVTGENGDHTFEAIDVTGNQIGHALYDGVASDFRANRHVNIRVLGNLIDCDPYHEHPRRLRNGGWATPPARGPAALDASRLVGVEFSGNTVRNSQLILRKSANSVVHIAYRNTLRCQPHRIGESRLNRGIGTIPPAGKQYAYIIEEADPTKDNYASVLNSNVLSAAQQPESGLYVQGHFVENEMVEPTDSGRILLGWLRRTTGTKHEPKVDWIDVWATTGF